MKTGEYIRTDDGLIGKIVSEPYEYKDSIGCDIDFGNNDIYNEYEMYQSIIKSSTNVIDLIEVGDYVNGHYVEGVEKVPNEEVYKVIRTSTCDGIDGKTLDIYKEEIESIVTKETFESMEYKIGE